MSAHAQPAPKSDATSSGSWTLVQRWVLGICIFQLAWALAFAASGALIATGLWALVSTQPAHVFTFPNNERDAVLHLATGFLFLGLGLIQLRRDRAAL